MLIVASLVLSILRCGGPRRHMVAVVSAAIKVCLINMTFIAMCPPDKRPRLYASGAAKKTREKTYTGQCGGQHE